MKRILSLLSFFAALSFIVVFSMLQVGCEEAPGLGGLTVSPSSVTLSTNSQVQTFAVTAGISNNLALPLTWSVSSATLGAITSNSGTNAIYQRTAVNGVNTITVRDQYSNEGYATVTQTASSYSLTLSASPASITVGQASTITITDGGTAPFAWSIASGSGVGTLVGPSGSRTATFTATATGAAAIQVTDANGSSGTVGITVTQNGNDNILD